MAVPHRPAWLASVVVRPYHVAQKLEHLFIKDNNDTNILTVKFSLHFTQKYYPVIRGNVEILTSPFLSHCKSLCLLSSAFTIDWRFVFPYFRCQRTSYCRSFSYQYFVAEVAENCLLSPKPVHALDPSKGQFCVHFMLLKLGFKC